MPNQEEYESYDVENEPIFSFRKIVTDFFSTLLQILQLKNWLLSGIIAGAILGIGYFFIYKKTYTAKLTFVVEDAKTTGGSLASAFAGQLGFDITGLSGASGIIGGDNVLELLRSSHFVKQTLLTPYCDSCDTTTTLADQYASIYHLKEKWKKNEDIGKVINFYPLKNKQLRLEDSLLQVLIRRITDNELTISKPDKKLNIFEIEATTRDEKFTQLFCERLLKITTDFYVDTKTNRLKRNVERLQKRADSIGMLLNKQTYVSSAETGKLIDLNPAYTTSSVTAEISARDKLVLSAIYTEIVKNLEVSKTALIQETPTIQIVDYPELPLKVNKLKWYWATIIGGLLGLTVTIIGLFSMKDLKKNKPMH